MVSEPCPISDAPVYTTTPPSRSILMLTVECGMSERMIELAAPLVLSAGDAESARFGHLAFAAFPAGAFDNLVNALRQAVTLHTQAVYSNAGWLKQITAANFRRINLQPAGDLIQ